MWKAVIQPSWRLGINNLSGRRGRTMLLAMAIALATGLVVALISSIASVRASIEQQLFAALGTTDARIVHPSNGRFEAALLDEVRAWPEVEQASGSLFGSLTLVRSDRGRDPETGQPRRLTPRITGFVPDAGSLLRTVTFIAGRAVEIDGEIMLDQHTAQALAVGVGDELHVQRFGDPIVLTVVGVYARPALGLIQRPEARITLSMLQEANDRPDQLTTIDIVLRPEFRDVPAFVERYREHLPAQVLLEPSEMARSGFDRQIRAGDIMLTLGAALAFMCCAFIVLTGLSTGITEQQRQMGIIRCLGGTRAQLFLSQLMLGAMIGGLGGLLGIPIGLGLALLVVWYYQDFITGGLVLSPMALIIGLCGSVGTGTLAALFPAWLATRVSPLTAMTHIARGARFRHLLTMTLVGFACLLLQAALTTPNDAAARFWLYALGGLPLMHVGYFLLGVPVFMLLTHAFSGALSTLLRLPGGLLKQTLLATPIRLGLTAGTLMVGIAILVSTWSNGTSLLSDWVDRMRFADGFAFSRIGVTTEQAAAIASLPFVTETCPIGYLPLELKDGQLLGVEGLAPPNVVCVGFDPVRFFRMNTVEWVQGSLDEALPKLQSGEGILVAEQFLTARGYGVGRTLTLGAGRVERTFEIVGVVSSAGLDLATQYFGIRSVYYERAISTVFVDLSVVSETFGNDDLYLLQINLVEGIDDEIVERAVAEAAPGVFFRSGRKVRESIDRMGYTLLGVYSTVALAAMLLACLAVGNVLIANVTARAFEYGMLRAVGGFPGTLLRLILAEATLLAMTAMILGTLLGLHEAFMGVLMYRDIAGLVISLRIPWLPTLAGWGLLLVLTLLAALPAALRILRTPTRELLAAGRAGI